MSDSDLPSRAARPPDRSEVTGPEQTDVYDVWEPPVDRHRGVTVALVHGGFWRPQYDRAHLAPLAETLARDGFHVANLEYPRVGMPGGGWPGTGTALLTTLRAVHDDTHLPGHVVAVGHSAGGHLVLWAASEDRAPWLVGVVALAPAADLREVHRLGLSDHAARNLLGPDADEEPASWDDADPARQRLTVPAVIITGEVDDVVPASVTDAYVASREEGEPLHTAVARGAGHFDVIDGAHPSYLLLLAEIEELALHTRPHG
jgi:acetyl esterase/lipase